MDKGIDIIAEIDKILLDPEHQIADIYSRFIEKFTEKYNEPETIAKQVIINLERMEKESAVSLAEKLIERYGFGGESTLVTTFIFQKNNLDIEKWKEVKGVFNNILGNWVKETQRKGSDKKSLSGNQYALLYILDCLADSEDILYGKKKDFINKVNERYGTSRGETVYRCFMRVNQNDFNNEKTLIEIGGDDWKNIIQYSFHRAKLMKDLKNKKLL